MSEKIAVIGLGYVGLPLVLELDHHGFSVVGFDIDQGRVDELKQGKDRTHEAALDRLKNCRAVFTTQPQELKDCRFYIVTVPTPVDGKNQPDLTPLRKASQTLAKVLKKGDLVVYESTVYPGVTEEVCGQILAAESGLELGRDFTLGYSPERINPGDKQRPLPKITKIVAGQDAATLERMVAVYGKIITAGLHLAPTIKVAEAAKVTENIQRDVNIALMNELAVVFEKMGISTPDVLKAAGTKWNFLPFTPGLVGGHCIGVDPYYLTSKSEEIGVYPELILTARRRNNAMASFIANKTVRLVAAAGLLKKGTKIGVLGVTFKENVPDLRNSKVPDLIQALEEYGVEVLLADPWVDEAHLAHKYPQLKLTDWQNWPQLDAVVFAVPHQELLAKQHAILARIVSQGVVIDLKAALPKITEHHYWAL